MTKLWLKEIVGYLLFETIIFNLKIPKVYLNFSGIIELPFVQIKILYNRL